MNTKGLLSYFKLFICTLLAFSLASCVVKPKPITPHERAARIRKDWQAMFNNNEPLKSRKIDIYQAMARALKYNLDIRLKMMEQAFSNSDVLLASFDMLPRTVASAGYVTRSNLYASSSNSLVPGTPPAPLSTSQDKSRWTGDLQMTWNILDFGVSYINNKQKSDQYMISNERRHKMIQNIIRDTRYAYWRAVGAQTLLAQLDPFMAQLKEAVNNSENIQSEKLKSPLEQLKYRKALLETLREMTQLHRDLANSKRELAALMNLKPGTHFYVVKPAHESYPLPRSFPRSPRILELLALHNRPELREEDYRHRIALKEITKARLRMLPGLELSTSQFYDSNSFLLNDIWAQGSARLVWNLIQVVSGPAAIRHAKFGVDVASLRRMALSMAVITQVDVAMLRYDQALREVNVTRKLRQVDGHIYKHLRNEKESNKATELQVILARANKILSNLRFDLAYAEWQNSGGQLYNSIGFDPLNKVTTINQPVAKLAKEIRISLNTQPKLEKVGHGNYRLASNKPRVATSKTQLAKKKAVAKKRVVASKRKTQRTPKVARVQPKRQQPAKTVAKTAKQPQKAVKSAA